VESASLEASALPRAGSALPEGSTPPRQGPSRSRAPACMSSALLPPYGHLMPRHRRTRATTLTRPGIASRRCSTDSLGEAIPATMWRCAMTPVLALRHCAAYPRTANTPSPRRGPAAPLNAFSVTMQGHAVTSAGGSGLSRRCQPCAAISATAAPRQAL
jgi:hypothetical protein